MIAVACIFTAIGIAAGIMLNSWIQKIQKDSAIKSADKIKKDAEREAEHLLRDARVSAKAETLKMREECELELKERRREQTTNEKRLAQREELLDRRARPCRALQIDVDAVRVRGYVNGMLRQNVAAVQSLCHLVHRHAGA